MGFAIGDRVVATDDFGNYYKEPGIVVGFEKNMFGRQLVMVELDRFKEYNSGPSCFYNCELTSESEVKEQETSNG